MNRALPAALLLAVVFLAPGAAACTLSSDPARFGSELKWIDRDTLLTNDGWDLGTYHLGTETFTRLGRAVGSLRANAVSPDGQWVVFTAGESVGSDCIPDRGHTYAVHLPTGSRTELLDEPAVAITGGTHGVLLWPRSTLNVTHYAWGAWDAPQELDLSPLDVERDPNLYTGGSGDRRLPWFGERSLSLSADGERLALRLGPALVTSRAWESRVLLYNHTGDGYAPPWNFSLVVPGGPFQTLVSLSPDGQYLLVQRATRGHELVLYALEKDALREVARHEHPTDFGGLAWGPGGGVTLWTVHHEPPEDHRTYRLRTYASPEAFAEGKALRAATFTSPWGPSRFVWSPDGERLAYGDAGTLYLRDRDLDIVSPQWTDALALGMVAATAAGLGLFLWRFR